MINSKHLISEITLMFFRSREFKIFNIVDGGYFISLGLTTSLETMEKLKNVFNGSDYGFRAEIVELESTKNDSGEYINRITGNEAKKFRSSIPSGATVLREESREKYPEISRVIESSEGGWNIHGILEIPNRAPVIFYDLVNYLRLENSELRIGIYVTEDN